MLGTRQDGDEDLPGSENQADPIDQPVPQAQPARREPPAAASSPKLTHTKFTHTKYMTRLALNVGFSQADLDENSPEFIIGEINALREHQRQQRQEFSPPAAAGSRPPAAGVSATLPTAAPKVEPVEEDPLDQIDKNPDNWDPVVVSIARRLRKAEEKASRVDAIEQRESARVKQTIGEAIEGAFEKLPEQVVGRGTLTEQPEGTKRRRQRIYSIAGVNPQVDSPRVIEQKINAAYADLYGDLPLASGEPSATAGSDATVAAYNGQPAKRPTPPQDPDNGRFVKVLPNGTRSRLTEDDWQQAAVARPTQRAGAANPGGIHVAKQKAAEYYKANGLDPGHQPQEGEDDDLPGD